MDLELRRNQLFVHLNNLRLAESDRQFTLSTTYRNFGPCGGEQARIVPKTLKRTQRGLALSGIVDDPGARPLSDN